MILKRPRFSCIYNLFSKFFTTVPITPVMMGTTYLWLAMFLFISKASFFLFTLLLWPRKGSQMKTQRRILDNRLYYTRKIELHRKGKKSRTLRITPIWICGICCSPHLTGKWGTRPFLGGSGRRAIAHTRPAFPDILRPRQHFPY